MFLGPSVLRGHTSEWSAGNADPGPGGPSWVTVSLWREMGSYQACPASAALPPTAGLLLLSLRPVVRERAFVAQRVATVLKEKHFPNSKNLTY